MEIIKFWLGRFKSFFFFCGGVSALINLLVALWIGSDDFLQHIRLRYAIVGAVILTSTIATISTIKWLFGNRFKTVS